MATAFYCRRKNGRVNVPNEKVCGYKMKNYDYDKYHHGLRVGKDNECGHRLSMFATEHDAKQKHPCAGNFNDLNYKGVVFEKEPKGLGHSLYDIERSGFKAGTVYKQTAPVPQLVPNQRQGLGNYDIERNNFIAPAILGRDPIDFDKISAINTAQFGQKVQLSDKTLGDLLAVKVPDPTDKQWLDEHERRIAAGETEEQLKRNPPWGREQRTTVKRVNFGEARLGLEGDIAALKAAVNAGKTESKVDRATLGAEIARVLGSAQNVERMTTSQLGDMATVARRLGIPHDYKKVFGHRFWSAEQIKNEKGSIALFIMSNIPRGRLVNKPLIRRDYDDREMPVELSELYRLASGRRVVPMMLDLKDMELLNAEPIAGTAVAMDAQTCVLNLVINSAGDDGWVDIQNTGIPQYVLGGVEPPPPAPPAKTAAEVFEEAGFTGEEEKAP